MGTTYDIGCKKCRERIWVGQRGAGLDKPRLYSTDRHLERLEIFLNRHLGHPLVFHHEYYFGDLGHTDGEYRRVKYEELCAKEERDNGAERE